jgi:putative hemolysin
MGRVPAVAESFEWRGLRFEIVDMDGKRIDKVLVLSKEQTAAANSSPASASITPGHSPE